MEAQVFIAMQSLNVDPPSSSILGEKIPKARRADPVRPSSSEVELIEEEKNLLLPYVSPRKPGAEPVMVSIPELLEEPTIPEGVLKPQIVTTSQDSIMPKLQELKFEDYDT